MADTKVIVIPEGKICDYIDGKFRNDTPEEYVRQTVEKRLVNEHKYFPEQIRVEYTLQLGSRKPRADIVIFESKDTAQTQENIKIIIECKKETVDARNAKDGVEQLKSYMSACPNCEWGMWTNGRQKEVFRKYVNDKGQIDFMDYNDIPSADGNLEDINRPSRASLKNAYDDNLLFTFKTCHNHIYVNDGMQKQPAFFELLKVIFCKIEDERNIPKPLEFYATSEERSNPDGQLTVKKRISKIFERVKNKKKYRLIFDTNDEIKLSPRSLAYIVSELQKYSLLHTNIDIKGKAYEEIVGANLRGDRGEFFTPRNVMKMVVEMINPQVDEKVLDSSCGTGGFLVTAMTHVMSQLERDFAKELGVPRDKWDSDAENAFQDRVSDMAKVNYFGFDINPDLVKATKMNMVMNNDGSGNILQNNSLLPPHEWTEDFRTSLAEALGIDKSSIRNHSTIGFFDVIVTNPPFGSKIPIRIDYYSAFMKAWIAFNAWYNYSGEIAGKNDKEHIDSIAQTSNRFREYIVNLLRAEDSEGASYRDNVANLHETLQNAALMTQEYIGTRQAISFSSVASKNLNAAERFDYYKNHYECTRIRGKIITSVKEKSTGVEIFHFEQDEYDEEALQQQSVYVSLTPTQRESCLRCYGKMTPYVIESVLSKPEDVGSPDRSKKIGAYSFVKDDVKISRAIVVVLYMLRCCLAHGDFSPDEASNNVYKYAYEVLCIPLKKLR